MKYPESYENLRYKYRVFVDCYLNEGLREPTTHKMTFNDELASYLFAYQKGREFLEAVEVKLYETDGFGNVSEKSEWTDGCRAEIVVKNVAKYMSMVKAARRIHGECIRAINDIRTVRYSSDDKSRELELKDAIYNSSLYAADSKDRNDNRKMMMKIMGLDQVKIDTSVDIYAASGRNILARMRSVAEEGGGDDAPIIPRDIEESGE